MKKDRTIILLLLGCYERQTQQLSKMLGKVNYLQQEAEVIIACDSHQWLTAPQMQMLPVLNEKISVVSAPQDQALPAEIMNLALEKVSTPYTQFALLSDPVMDCADMFQSAIRKNENEAVENAVFFITPKVDSSREVQPTLQNAYGWAQCSTSGFGLGSFCISKKVLEKIGKIDESPMLATEVERWFALKIIENGSLICAGEDTQGIKHMAGIPQIKTGRPPHDLAIRYAVYASGIAAEPCTMEERWDRFGRDLNDEEYRLYSAYTGVRTERKAADHKHFKILILGGFWEYHHNQICFYNYLEKLYGHGFATYRPAFDTDVSPNMILGYDLVIFSRCRSNNALELMRFCDHRGIPTLYMIDDNWISIAEDHPKEGAVFVPGNPDYDNFLEALGLCKATWLFSDLIREDVLPYTRCVKKFGISVDSHAFETEKVRKKTDEELYVGFAGSLRWDDTAFRALARYARRHKNIKLVLIGTLSESQERLFRNLPTIRIGFESYSRYAQTIREISPDLLIVPSTGTRTMRSKCYNKYIESGIVGTACIYSKVPPYTDVVTEGENGFFVSEETENAWYEKLCQVLDNIPQLRNVQKHAKEDVLRHYTVEVLLPDFIKKLTEVIEEDAKDD